jgi:hypothetical protein
MAWNFSGNSGDPLEKRRRQLEEQQRKLSAEMSKLQDSLQVEKNPPPPPEPGPPVWRLEEEQSFIRDEQAPEHQHGQRSLRAQRQRDFRIFIVLFLVLAVILYWLFRTFIR